ncbi:MAG: phosphatase PAP2 family protein, partial [Anaerolineales bacterium]|nr:phosphatase PAP2 family protein [Anaerolineales bacterium]
PKWGWQVTTALGTITLLVLIGISQMALGTHYLSDVVAGLMAGIFWLGTTILLSELIAPAQNPVSGFRA